jgi:hypothetical protein
VVLWDHLAKPTSGLGALIQGGGTLGRVLAVVIIKRACGSLTAPTLLLEDSFVGFFFLPLSLR